MSFVVKMGFASTLVASFLTALSLNYDKALSDEKERIDNPPLSPTGEPLVMIPCQASPTGGISGENVTQKIADNFSVREICTNPDIKNIDIVDEAKDDTEGHTKDSTLDL